MSRGFGLYEPVFDRSNLDAPFQKLLSVSTTLGTTDYVPTDECPRAIWVGADGLIKVLMIAEQPGNDSAAVTIPVLKGCNPIAIQKIYKTGTDTALVTAGIWVGW